MFSLLSYGEILVDFLPSDDTGISYTPKAGGAPANVAVGYAKLGGDSYFAGSVSQDNFGQFLTAALSDDKVNIDYVETISGVNTAIVLVSLDTDGERTFNFYRENSADIHYSRAAIDNIEWSRHSIFHFCSNTLTSSPAYENTLYALEQAKANKQLISFDVNIRLQLWSDISSLPPAVELCMHHCDLVKLSKDELIYLAERYGKQQQEYLAHLLSLGVKLIVVTDGPNEVQLIANEFEDFISVPKVSAVDTTAAGDSFISGFIYSIAQQSKKSQLNQSIINGGIVRVATVFAAQCSALTCQRKGAFSALPHLAELNIIKV